MNAAFDAIQEDFGYLHARMCRFFGNDQTYVQDTCVKCVLERREPDEQFFDLVVSRFFWKINGSTICIVEPFFFF